MSNLSCKLHERMTFTTLWFGSLSLEQIPHRTIPWPTLEQELNMDVHVRLTND